MKKSLKRNWQKSLQEKQQELSRINGWLQKYKEGSLIRKTFEQRKVIVENLIDDIKFRLENIK
jgi:hypothetical protein